MTELGSDAKALVNAARTEGGLPADQRARLRARVLATAGSGGMSVAGSIVAKAAAAKVLGMSVVTWGAVAATVAGAGSFYAMAHPRTVHTGTPASKQPAVLMSPAPRAIDAAESPAAPVPTATPHSTARDDRPRASRPKPLDSKERTTAPASADSSFVEDARLLRDVRAALAAGQGERALGLLDARQENPASGVFAEEREAARIVTLCSLRRREAPEAAARFLAAHGSSPLAERVRRACPK
jgi:hypothetical protein